MKRFFFAMAAVVFVFSFAFSAAEISDKNGDLIKGGDLKSKTIEEVADIYGIDAGGYSDQLSRYVGLSLNPKDSFQLLHDNYGLEPSVAKDIALSLKLDSSLILPESNDVSKGRPYYLLPVSLFLVFLYAAGYALSKKGVISVVAHRKVWNFVLLVTFLVSGVLGILLILRISFGFVIPLPFNILFWHVEAGIAMFVISVFHVLWHLSYFRNMLKF
ncbi:MAG: hypothetical protein J7K00_04250 [Candidatus Diapherotrites archaeon]|nr:hypothetical protein [Candidatus Diapherotrites archaeon]